MDIAVIRRSPNGTWSLLIDGQPVLTEESYGVCHAVLYALDPNHWAGTEADEIVDRLMERSMRRGGNGNA